MKICIISTTVIVCPPKGYSGLEMITYLQATGLANKGHKVLLIAPIGSSVPNNVELHGTTLFESEKQAYSGYWHRLPDYDVIIDSSWEKWSYILKMENKLKAPILGVCHAPVHTMYKVPPPVPHPCIIAISKDQAQGVKEAWNIEAKVAYNGVDTNFYKSSGQTRNDRYLFLARMSIIKGPHIAVEIAKKCNVGLDLVGDDKITGEPEYAAQIKAQAIGEVIYRGEATREKAVEFFSTRKALFHTAQQFREPFGLSPVEAQLCGMPVITFDNGAMRETVKHGETGFVVKTQEEFENIVKNKSCDNLSRKKCREWANQFSVTNMVDRYEELAKEALETGGW